MLKTILALVCLALAGCVTLPTPRASAPPESAQPRRIAIFFDGTSNDTNSGTNVFKLYDAVNTTGSAGVFYIEGVGAQGKPIGMAMAWGIGMRVRASYSYLLTNYRPGDQVYVFGFSRGAYSARILASLLYHAGLPATPTDTTNSDELAEMVYDAFKGEMSSLERIQRVQRVLSERRLPSMAPVDVKFMGLWDTVEALGWPDYEENVDVPNPRYGDQLCNVEQAAHALSLDDNRARIFTRLLLTRLHLLSDCGRDRGAPSTREQIAQRINAKVEEVYFSGAHADVGGGYEDDIGGLSGVSLNWMVHRAQKAGLPISRSEQNPFPANPLAAAHDAEGELPHSLIYKRMYRSIDAYADAIQSTTPTVKFHASLRYRIESCERSSAEYGGPDPDAQQVLKAAGPGGRFNTCFVQAGISRQFAASAACKILIPEDPPFAKLRGSAAPACAGNPSPPIAR